MKQAAQIHRNWSCPDSTRSRKEALSVNTCPQSTTKPFPLNKAYAQCSFKAANHFHNWGSRRVPSAPVTYVRDLVSTSKMTCPVLQNKQVLNYLVLPKEWTQLDTSYEPRTPTLVGSVPRTGARRKVLAQREDKNSNRNELIYTKWKKIKSMLKLKLYKHTG